MARASTPGVSNATRLDVGLTTVAFLAAAGHGNRLDREA
jgi:hypothetical protein